MLISLIGIDGSGKTTLGKLLESNLSGFISDDKKPLKVKYLKPVSNESTFVKHFKYLLENDSNFDGKCQNYMFVFERYRTTQEVLLPNMENNDIIIMDRYVHCDIAFSKARERTYQMFYNLLNSVPNPDIGFVIDVPAHTAMKRILKRDENIWDFQENEKLLRKTRKEYLNIAQEFNYHVVDGLNSLEVSLDSMMGIIKQTYNHNAVV